MGRIRAIITIAMLTALAGCGSGGSKFLSYDGPEVTRILVQKGEREMYLLHHGEVLRQYRIGLGFAPEGHKRHEGDGRTPEGTYFIDKRNPNSNWYLSIGISYPNAADVQAAKFLGKPPGGDIFIHGRGPNYKEGSPADWTWGCIAVKDKDMAHIYAMVRDGTPITILP